MSLGQKSALQWGCSHGSPPLVTPEDHPSASVHSGQDRTVYANASSLPLTGWKMMTRPMSGMQVVPGPFLKADEMVFEIGCLLICCNLEQHGQAGKLSLIFCQGKDLQ